MRKKRSLRERIGYLFDKIMARGTGAMIGLLFLVTFIVVFILALFQIPLGNGSIGFHMWSSLMHVLDGGTLAGDAVGNIWYIVLMSVATLCGIFVTSILIGIITTGFETRLENLRQGKSVVIDENHTVILGFNDRIYILLKSLIEANENHRNQCVVVVGDMEVPAMQEEIRTHIEDFGTTHVLCRSGELTDASTLKKAGLENAAHVLINQDNDAGTIKAILSVMHYLGETELLNPELFLTAVINEEAYLEPARLAGKGRVEIIFAKDAIARLIAHTCGQNGLCTLLSDLLNYDGDELYYEAIPQLEGKTFAQTLNLFEKQVVFGIAGADGEPHLNPPMDTVIGKDSRMILLEADDGAWNLLRQPGAADEGMIIREGHRSDRFEGNLLIIGCSDELPGILREYDHYVSEGTRVTVLVRGGAQRAERMLLPARPSEGGAPGMLSLSNLSVSVAAEDKIDKTVLLKHLSGDTANVLLLLDDSVAPEQSDTETLLHLIELSAIKRETGRRIAVTSEMYSRNNQTLASMIGAKDFVLGSNLTGLLAVQVSQNRGMAALFQDLLDEDGSELYMKPAEEYVRTGFPVNFYTVTESAAGKSEIAVGYKKVDPQTGDYEIITNPPKSELRTYTAYDFIIVIAQD